MNESLYLLIIGKVMYSLEYSLFSRSTSERYKNTTQCEYCIKIISSAYLLHMPSRYTFDKQKTMLKNVNNLPWEPRVNRNITCKFSEPPEDLQDGRTSKYSFKGPQFLPLIYYKFITSYLFIHLSVLWEIKVFFFTS